MSTTQPRFHKNELQPTLLDDASLLHALTGLQTAIAECAKFMRNRVSPRPDNDKVDSLYTGDSGIALMFLRLAVQYEATGMNEILGPEFRSQIPSIISDYLPPLQAHHVRAGNLSPFESPVGPALVYILSSLSFPSITLSGKTPTNKRSSEENDWLAAVTTLRRAVRSASEDESLGGDEVLYGRAGLLWGMLNLQVWLADKGSKSQNSLAGLKDARTIDLERITGGHLVEEVLSEILEAGDAGAQLYRRSHGEDGIPLLWEWHGKYYLGAVHGVAGILTVVLQAPRLTIAPHLHIIKSCIGALCELTSQNDGYLPSSLPLKPHSRQYVQICHGSPGLLLLLTTFRARFPQEWKLEWDAVEAVASEKIWNEGLLTKGLGVCHGLSGNAWPWLLQAHEQKRTPEGDAALARALTFLLHSRKLPPISPPSSTSGPIYRTPDHPYSLFEGLAGTICAWLDACVILRSRLSNTDAPTDETPPRDLVLGIPGLGGARVHGIL